MFKEFEEIREFLSLDQKQFNALMGWKKTPTEMAPAILDDFCRLNAFINASRMYNGLCFVPVFHPIGLRYIRIILGLSHKDIAVEAGTTALRWKNWEYGKCKVPENEHILAKLTALRDKAEKVRKKNLRKHEDRK